MNLIPIFITGLTIGGLTCMAVQGGILASLIAAREEKEVQEKQKRKQSLWPVAFFLGAKLIAYTLLGLVLGVVGQALAFTETTQTIMQFVAGIYMIAVALYLFNIHPIFRYVLIQPPKAVRKWAYNQTTRTDVFAPALFGLATIFMPCGTTLAMEALAISSGSAFWGAAIMATFVIATMPVFFGLGWITTVLGDAFQQKFLKVAALVLVYVGVISINGGLNAIGSPITLQSIGRSFYEHSRYANQSTEQAGAQIVNGVQAATIEVYPTSYSPKYLQLKAGVPVELTLNARQGLGCTSIFTIPQLGIRTSLQQTSTQKVTFIPEQPGRITFTCGMGMYSGVLDVI
jgi:uncharacterized protein